MAEDRQVVRDGLRMVLQKDEDLEIVGEAGTGKEVLQLGRKVGPEVVIIDINMPDMNGTASTRKLKETLPGISVIGLSVQDDAATEQAMREADACAYLLKSGSSEELFRKARSCFRREEEERVWSVECGVRN